MARNASIQKAEEAVKMHAVAIGTLKEGQLFADAEEEAFDTAVSDLLADLMHLCDDHDGDFEYLLGRATNYYNDEV